MATRGRSVERSTKRSLARHAVAPPQLLRRVAAEDVAAVLAPSEESPVAHLAKRPGDRGGMRGDQAREQVVREVDRQHRRVAVAGAPAAREVPEERLQPRLGTDELAD